MELLRYLTVVVHWLLLAFVILYIITGLGVTNYEIIEAVTFGGFTKLGTFQLHSSLLIPFIIVLALHIALTVVKNRQKRNINVA
jgi:thiosulfate reductase cytochrome b subunit